MRLLSLRRLTLLLVILWLAGCTAATTEALATPDHAPTLVQPSPTPQPVPMTVQPEKMENEDSDDLFKKFERILAPYQFADESVIVDTPPASFQAPVSGFGKLWRGELLGTIDDTVRERLGWARGAEFNYDAAYQCEERTHPRSWACYLLAPDGQILELRPASTLGAHLLWRERTQPAN